MSPARRMHRRHAVAAAVAAPIIAIGSLTAVGLAQPAPGAIPATASEFAFGQAAANGLARAGLWTGPTDAALLSRDATRRELVMLLQSVMGLPAGPLGTTWRDVTGDDPQGAAARRAVQRGWLSATGGQVALDAPLTGTDANRAWTLALGMGRAVARLSRFTDGSGHRFTVPAGFATSIAARESGLRRNYPTADDVHERTDQQPLRLADLVLMAWRGRDIRRRGLPASARSLQAFSIPAIDPLFVPLVQRALNLVGHPYVWGGEWPGRDSPLDPQAAGGFDCSGFVWYVWRTGDRASEAAINVPDGRTTYTMNVGTRGKRIAWHRAAAGDLVFFGDRGLRTPLNQASHMAIGLGNKWIIHSSGGRGGVSISYLPTYWPRGLQNARTFRVSDTVAAAPDTPSAMPPAGPTPSTEPVTPAPGAPQQPAPAPGGAQPPAP
jgi:cell wall-associated NlpC family hydrolase